MFLINYVTFHLIIYLHLIVQLYISNCYQFLALLGREGPGSSWELGPGVGSASFSFSSIEEGDKSSRMTGRGSMSSSSSSLSKRGPPLRQFPWQFWQAGEHLRDAFLHPHLVVAQSFVHRQKIIFNISSGAACC